MADAVVINTPIIGASRSYRGALFEWRLTRLARQ